MRRNGRAEMKRSCADRPNVWQAARVSNSAETDRFVVVFPCLSTWSTLVCVSPFHPATYTRFCVL